MCSILKFRNLVVTLMLFALMGCSSPPIKFDITADNNINPNDEKNPLPVVVRFYLLSEDQSFNSSSFEELWKNDVEVLGDSLLSHEEIVLTPASVEKLVMERKEGTKFAGVIAIFRESTDDQWRVIKPVPDNYVSKHFTKTVRVTLRGNIVEIE